MLKKLIILRHGEVPFYKVGFLSKTDLTLTEKGLKEVEKIAKELKGEGIQAIFSSPLLRCVQTARVIARELGFKQIILDESLEEVNFGIFECLSLEEARKKYPKIYEARLKDKWNFKIPGGESYKDAAERFLNFLRKIEASYETVLCITHVTLIKIILKILCGLSLEEIERRKYLPACFLILNKKEKWEIEKSKLVKM